MNGTKHVKGFTAALTVADLARLERKPQRFVREKLLKTGALRAHRLGGNGWRVYPEDYEDFRRRGATGFRHARPSGGRRAAKAEERT